MTLTLRTGGLAAIVLALPLLAGCGSSGGGSAEPTYRATIERTTFGVPHITAQDYAGLGYGQGYAIAEDNLCVLADGYVTFRGERSLHFGPDARPATSGTFGQPLNLDADFFFRFVVDDATVAAFRDEQPAQMQQLAEGFAAGYNRYLREIRDGAHAGRHVDCRDAAWLQEIGPDDVYRRLITLNLAASSSLWIAEIAGAQPPTAAAMASSKSAVAPLDPERFLLGRQHGIGSNTFAFGSDATGTASGLSFANPHWYLDGIDRFYQQHLILEGEMNISGATILGLPLVAIGFTDEFAWSHTVSTARRFGFYELTLADGKPTTYLYDGEERELVPSTITVPTQDGGEVTRTLYRSHYGPMIDLSDFNDMLTWSGNRAYALRDVNLENRRSFANFLAWDQAGSLQEFIDVKKELVAIPWVNTAAAGRDDGRAFYADITAVPNVPTDLVAECTAQPFGAAFANIVPGLPFLDGARSECEWRTDADSAQDGAFGPGNLPSLERADYVANMNGSHWLSNPAEPLTGYARIIGDENSQQSPRTRMGHVLAQQRLDGSDGLPGSLATSETVRDIVLNSRNFGAELLKDDVHALVCTDVEGDEQTACDVLDAWNNTGNLDASGGHIWSALWPRIRTQEDLFAVPFDANDPVNTPRELNGTDPDVAQAVQDAFSAAVQEVADSGVPFDAQVRDYQRYPKAGTDIPHFGGEGSEGYFTVLRNTYMHVVDFPQGEPVRAYTFLAHSQSSDPASPHYADYTEAYADKDWHRTPYTRGDIEAQRISRVELEE